MSETKEMIEIKAGEKVELYRRSFSSVPMAYEFNAAPSDNDELRGKVEVQTKKSLGKMSAATSKLQRSNTVKASMWDTFVTIYVMAENDLQVTLPKRKIRGMRMIFGLLLLVAVAAVIIIQQTQ